MFIFLQQNDLYVRYLHMICKSFDVMKEHFVFIIILRYDASKDKKKENEFRTLMCTYLLSGRL